MNPPNKIDRTISPEDLNQFERKSALTLAEEMMHHLEYACPYNCTFNESIPFEKRKAAEAILKADFERWANSWLAPKLRQIIAKENQ